MILRVESRSSTYGVSVFFTPRKDTATTFVDAVFAIYYVIAFTISKNLVIGNCRVQPSFCEHENTKIIVF